MLFILVSNIIHMGLLDKLRGKKKEAENTTSGATTTNESAANKQNPSGKRIKKYTSDGKPVYE
jgi:hypothetical protein